ncbi:hypothetical protein MGYG_07240 [Nannizzia gypsea CBS 118893]|uniref:Uncharacterized protein n=1 Tax=Arthroderma gypseum (strain ATCC MYA-4604 / CBS 118893) TaxID=535722 RepID=E4V2G8_ARTGP|nr:hypothetical protein MGYG_07240 [Nannizzia gypsea CBS 118893]EFR04233.1 hypothetical protein MGYG_07240 [Nannizzia gypsea CBS 118893]
MSGFKGLVKEGWHPKGNDGGRESWRGDFKGINQVAGWMGKGKSTGGGTAPAPRASQPISSLKDPATFGPPPQRGKPQQQQQQQSGTHSVGAGAKPAPPPVPRRSTETLGHGQGQGQSRPSLPPRLPPRRSELDHAGAGAGAGTTYDSPPPAYELAATPAGAAGISTAASAAANRLGAAGVSVPAFGINKSTNQSQTQHHGSSVSVPPQVTQAAASVAQSELQQRFSQMNRSVPPPPPASAPPSTQQQQQQQAPPPPPQRASTERTTSNTSLNSFRERHNDHIQAGMNKLSGFDQKYGISKKINNFIEDQKSPAYPQQQPGQQPQQQGQGQYQHAAATPPPPPPPAHPNHPYTHTHSNTGSATDLNKRKPPPPPPPMKPGSLTSNAVGQSHSHSPSPPPLPLNTKPR